MASTVEKLRGLILSAVELRDMHPEWTEGQIEDYLNLINSLVTLADEIDTKEGNLKNTVIVTAGDSPYKIEDDDDIVYYVTTLGPIFTELPPGVDGKELRLINATPTSDNNVTLSSDGADKLLGSAVDTEFIAPEEVLVLNFAGTVGWW